ncbi:MAG TPA: PucR family transcriptional regulator ligand-binding domain-containing protein [Kineosporiaceae bacterium]|nr:PucR family transcriptional regulator ligand-binding domain-containing protein [Kineosporiaceae bacterium]
MAIPANPTPSTAQELPVKPRTPTSERLRTASGRLARGLSVEEVLMAEALQGSQVLAGASGLGRSVERLNVMEVPDILPWVKPRELLITTGYPLRDDPAALAGLVADLDERGVSALGVKLGRYLHELPGAMLAEADRRGFPVIRLPDGAAFDDILEQVLTDLLNRQAAALARSEEVHRALVQIVLDGGGLPEVATELVQLLGAAVLITTPDGRVLADGGEVDALAAVYGSVCCDASGRLRTESTGPGLGAVPGLPGNRIVVPVVAGRVDHGRIAAFSPDGRLTAEDLHALEAAATVAALAVTKQLAVRAVESKYQGDFLRDLITGEVGPDQAVTHSASLGWDVDRPVVVVVAELDALAEERRGSTTTDGAGAGTGTGTGEPTQALVPLPALERFAAAWQTVVRPRDPSAPVVGFHREVVAVLGVPPKGSVDRLVRDLVREVAGDGGGGRRPFSTGVSRVAGSPSQIAAAYEQARIAVRVGRRMQGPGAVAYFDALGVFRLLSLVEDQAELRAFADEVLGDLARTDDDEIADLRQTLQVLLECNLNVAETARVLHFHYNTLRYRIAKLERLLGPFTRDPDLRLSLQLALQVLQMRGA